MAAKQGLGAQFAQAGEDAKRAVLSRTGVTSSSWFSNLNTVCTIKSAPPRSPEVLQMLATKSGWLYKRNEQHVWQPRWCCVVPHTFLYYFDAANVEVLHGTSSGSGGNSSAGSNGAAAGSNAAGGFYPYYPSAQADGGGGGGHHPLHQPTQQQQDEWNSAILTGYQNQRKNRKQHEKRSNYFLFNPHPTSTASTMPSTSNNTLATPTTNGGGGGGGGGGIHTLSTGPGGMMSDSHHDHGTSGGVEGCSSASGGNGVFDGAGIVDPSLFLEDNSNGNAASKLTNLQPTGIIDLECYTQVHRSRDNPLVLELAGDDLVNPDLRAFYFCSTSVTDSESWTDAMLNGRHSALVDECDAYKQVCDGFAQQLQLLHSELDTSTTSLEEAQEELYAVRCQTEESRRTCWRMVEECLVVGEGGGANGTGNTDNQTSHQPKSGNSVSPVSVDETEHDDDRIQGRNSEANVAFVGPKTPNPMQQKRADFGSRLETVRSQDMGLTAAVQLLCSYTQSLQDVYNDLYQHNERLEAEMRASGRSDQARVAALTQELQSQKTQYDADQTQWQQQVDTLSTKLQQSQKELQDVQKELSSTRMEVTMYQAQQRTKVSELTSHKKILKKEVMDLRTKLERVQAELSAIKLQETAQGMRAEQERQKNALLERYVEKMESQVKVQQNMMELMSQTGGSGSVYGGGPNAGSVYGGPNGTGAAGSGNNTIHSPRPALHHAVAGLVPPTDVVVHAKNDSPTPHMDGDVEEVMGNQSENHVSGSSDDDQEVGDSAENDRLGLRLEEGEVATNPKDARNELLPLLPTDNHHSGSRQYAGAVRRVPSGGPGGVVTSATEDMDNKSHVSELTEDRTQRQFEAMTREYASSSSPYHHHSNGIRHKSMVTSPRPAIGPPPYIIGVNNRKSNASSGSRKIGKDNKQAAQNSGASLPSTPPMRRSEIPRGNTVTTTSNVGIPVVDSQSVSSEPRKVSVAQRARLEADRQTTPVRVRVDDVTVQAAVQKQQKSTQSVSGNSNSGRSGSSVPSRSPSGLWRRVGEAMLGHGGDTLSSESEDDDDDDEASARSSPIINYQASGSCGDEDNRRRGTLHDEKKTTDSVSHLSLQERCELQRANQLRFLRNQGLIRDESDVKGGARRLSDSGSVASSSIVSLQRPVSTPQSDDMKTARIRKGD